MAHKTMHTLGKNQSAELIRQQREFEDAAIASRGDGLDEAVRGNFDVQEYFANPARLRFSDASRRELLDVLGTALTPLRMFKIQVLAHRQNDLETYTKSPRELRELPSRVARLCKELRASLNEARTRSLALTYLIVDSKLEGSDVPVPPDGPPKELLVRAAREVDHLITKIDRMTVAAERDAEAPGRTGRPREHVRDELIVLLAHWYQTVTGRRAGWSAGAQFPAVVEVVLRETRNLYVPKHLHVAVRNALKPLQGE